MSERSEPGRKFNISQAAWLLGVSESYMRTLELEGPTINLQHRSYSGERVYSSSDIMVLRRMGVGKSRGRRLRYQSDVKNEMGFITRQQQEEWADTLEAELRERKWPWTK